MVIHIDTLVLENIIVNYFLLHITSQTVRLKVDFKNILISAALGGLYVITMVFPQLRLFTVLPFKILVAFIMIFILFGKKDLFFYLKALVIYMLYSMLLAGLCIFLEFNKNPYGNFSGAIYNFSYKKLMLSLIILYLLINRLIVYIKDRKNVEMLIFIVGIIAKNKEKKVSAFLDTGNELREPSTNLPVMIIEKSYISDLSVNDKELFYIPYKVLNGQTGQLKGFKPDYIKVYNGREFEKREVIIAFCENRLSDYNEYHALLSRGII